MEEEVINTTTEFEAEGSRFTVNAQITNTQLAPSENGVLGGVRFAFVMPTSEDTTAQGDLILQIDNEKLTEFFKVVGVKEWESVVGKYIRVTIEGKQLVRIANILTDNVYMNTAQE